MPVSANIRSSIANHRYSWLATAIGLPIAVYGTQLLLLTIRFGQYPNYLTAYDWTGNLWRIIRSTSSIVDVVTIGSNEWLLEIGRMNHDYGSPISEWSFELLPANMLFVFLVGVLVATGQSVIRQRAATCGRRQLVLGIASTGVASSLAAITSVTVSWVACCGAPSWVTGLSILGLGFSMAQALKPFGVCFEVVSLTVLTLTPLLLARSQTEAGAPCTPLTNTVRPDLVEG